MRVLVTGANGYIGTGVVKELIKRKEYVVAADIDLSKVCKEAETIKCDLFEIDDPYSFFGQPDVLIHLAWRDGFKHNSANHLRDLPKHYEFLKKMIDSGIRRVCILGSMHEVGFYEGCVNELTPCNPISLYGISKNALRNAAQEYARIGNTEFIWLRGYYIVGNSKEGNSIFSKITYAAEHGEKEFPFITGRHQYDFIEYNLFCRQIAAAALQNRELGIINCCSGYPQRLGEVVEKFIEDNSYHIKLKYGAFPERSYDSEAIWGDGKKIQRILENESAK